MDQRTERTWEQRPDTFIRTNKTGRGGKGTLDNKNTQYFIVQEIREREETDNLRLLQQCLSYLLLWRQQWRDIRRLDTEGFRKEEDVNK